MGGNVRINGREADRLDFRMVDRVVFAHSMERLMECLNDNFFSLFGEDLWETSLKDISSGSTKHFFDFSYLTEAEFLSSKPVMGDFDFQVSLEHEKRFLHLLEGLPEEFEEFSFIGFKKSACQVITLWSSKVFGVNVQIDFEFVEFKDGKPTEWSQFAHSSEWDDLRMGIKGVFHKYMLRALTVRSLKSMILLKGKSKKPVKTFSSELAFSVLRGLRVKVKAVFKGNAPDWQDGYPVFEEIPIKDSDFITDIPELFRVFFGCYAVPYSFDLQEFRSSVGVVRLVKKYWAPNEQCLFIHGFANTLWGPTAQQLYRDDPDQDRSEKETVFKYVVDTLAVPYDKKLIGDWVQQYYKDYKKI